MNRTKYLMKNTVVFAIGNIGSKLINFFLIPLYTNYLTTDQYGITDLIFTVCSIALPVIILNINEAIMRFCLDQKTDRNRVMSVGIAVILLSFLLAVPLCFAASLYTKIAEYRLYIYLYLVTYGICEVNVFYLRGNEQVLAFSVSNMLRTFFIALFNILFLVVLRRGIPGYLLAFIIANALTAMYAFITGKIWRVFPRFRFDRELFSQMVRYSFPLIPNSFMWWIIDSSDRIMIVAMVGAAVSGIYAVSSKITALISFISTIFNQAYMYSAVHEEDSEDRGVFHNRILDTLFAAVTAAGILVLTLIKPFMRVYVSAEFYSAWKYAPPLIIGTSILVLATFLSVFYTVNKDSMGFLKSASIGAALNIVLNLTLIPLIGALGAAIATCASYIAVFVFRSIDTKKYVELDIYSVRHMVSFGLLLLMGFSAYLPFWAQAAAGTASLAVTMVQYRASIRFALTKLRGLLPGRRGA